MTNHIRHVAVHDLRRTSDGFSIVLGQHNLPVNPTTQRVVDKLHTMYSKRSSKVHGNFSNDLDNYPTRRYFQAYLAGEEAGDFNSLTSKLMTTLAVQTSRRPAAGGGHIFFAHFARDAREFILVAIVNEKLSAALTAELGVRDITHLDLDGFRFAGRVDISSWQSGDQRYIGFLRGRGDVSEYFKEFLGCDATVADKQNTQEFVNALKNFAHARGMQAAERDDFLSRAKEICTRTSRQGQELDFQILANELIPDDPAALAEYLGDPDRLLTDGFIPNLRVLGTLVKFKASTELWSIEIDRGALREGQIVFNEDDNSLTIRNIPEQLAAELIAELAGDDET